MAAIGAGCGFRATSPGGLTTALDETPALPLSCRQNGA
ncbi:hypothetical protein Ga0080574_TMP1727 [Salipiger abyssi]|uniref:Uncharacterized protein n=1 Tax=Salipiger abyssi TaxID=1250539 RepID=A0A1P8URP4_9RHOB|nr:hypothetical protein Ga0080574_TMP1727 [Salipiger abyssi]